MVKVHYCSVSKSEWLLSTKKGNKIYIYSGNKDLQAWSKNQSCQAQSILSGNKKGLPHIGEQTWEAFKSSIPVSHDKKKSIEKMQVILRDRKCTDRSISILIYVP